MDVVRPGARADELEHLEVVQLVPVVDLRSRAPPQKVRGKARQGTAMGGKTGDGSQNKILKSHTTARPDSKAGNTSFVVVLSQYPRNQTFRRGRPCSFAIDTFYGNVGWVGDGSRSQGRARLQPCQLCLNNRFVRVTSEPRGTNGRIQDRRKRWGRKAYPSSYTCPLSAVLAAHQVTPLAEGERKEKNPKLLPIFSPCTSTSFEVGDKTEECLCLGAGVICPSLASRP